MIAALGVRHGIHHGTGCGILLAAATRVNIAALRSRQPGGVALGRYAEAARVLTGERDLADPDAADALVAWLAELVGRLGLPRLGELGVQPADFASLVADARGSSMRTNPVSLEDREIEAILAGSL
jgi:alcohol dehydrogenase